MRTYFEPTTVQRIRAFLAEQGMAMRPWSGASEVLQELERLLQARACDASFWASLRGLLAELVGSSEGGVGWRVGGAEVLSPERIDGVIVDIRRALAVVGRAPRPFLLLSKLAAPGLCAVLLLGMAAGCDDGGGAGKADVVQTDDGAQTDDADQVEYSTVEEYVSNSDLSWMTKSNLLECLKGFTSSERSVILDYFQDHTAEEIAAYLLELSNSEKCEVEPDVMAMDVYKGVSFPR